MICLGVYFDFGLVVAVSCVCDCWWACGVSRFEYVAFCFAGCCGFGWLITRWFILVVTCGGLVLEFACFRLVCLLLGFCVGVCSFGLGILLGLFPGFCFRLLVLGLLIFGCFGCAAVGLRSVFVSCFWVCYAGLRLPACDVFLVGLV